MPEAETKLKEISAQLQSNKIGPFSAYSVLSDIVKANPELAEQVFDTFKTAVQSDKNNIETFQQAYFKLGEIAKANPALAEQVFDTLKTTMQSDKNNELSLTDVYWTLGNITEANPALAEQAIDMAKTARKDLLFYTEIKTAQDTSASQKLDLQNAKVLKNLAAKGITT